MIKIDGKNYDEIVATVSFKEKATILNGNKSGRLQSGEMYIETIGTFYNATIKMHRKTSSDTKRSLEEWDDLYYRLTDPNNKHFFILPHNQGTREFWGYVSECSRELLSVRDGKNFWGDFTIEVVSIKKDR